MRGRATREYNSRGLILMDILWWHWLVLGLLLVLAELAASGGFYIIFFGIAALIVGCWRAPVWPVRSGLRSCCSPACRS